MSKVRVPVTQEHIDKGDRDNAASCPIVWALEDVGIDAYVFIDRIKVRDHPDPEGRIAMSNRLQKWVASFDADGEVEPINIQITDDYCDIVD